jgi:predicted Zn-dependent peptidase
MNKIRYEQIQESLYYETLDNGLQVYLLPKKGFSKTYANLSTSLGGMHTHIRKNGQVVAIPQGVAHFLEHKLFERDNKDVSIEFSKMEAEVNAYTQIDRTAYIFTATDNIKENINLLLDFVLHPQFTQDGVDREKDIIGQEIKMNLDNPLSQAYTTIMELLYPNHSSSHEILGSEDSINTITKQVLMDVHNTYYAPDNLILFVAGNIIPDDIIRSIKDHMADRSLSDDYAIVDVEEADYETIKEPTTIFHDVSTPYLIAGIKLPVYHGRDLLKNDLLLGIVLDQVFGKSSSFYQEALDQNLINDSFGKEASLTTYYSNILIGGETKYPQDLLSLIRKHLKEAKNLSLTEEEFLRIKKRFIGSFVTAFNYLEFIANNFYKYHHLGHSLFDMISLYQEISLEDVDHFIKTTNCIDHMTHMILMPNKKMD